MLSSNGLLSKIDFGVFETVGQSIENPCLTKILSSRIAALKEDFSFNSTSRDAVH